MDTEMVAPSQLHRDLERAKDAGEERKNILATTLGSQNLAVIRRIPELLSPLSDEEKVVVAQWAEGLTQDQDVSNRDFAFHLMVNCEVSAERIISILERNKTFSRHALEHIQQMLQTSGPIQQLDSYLREVAETLLGEEAISPRDRGRHMLMTLVRNEDDWQPLARRFSETEVSDLRQRVLERFLQECPDGVALTLLVENVVKMCLDCVRGATKEDVHKEASHMHWVLMCLERVERKGELSQAASLFKNKFGTALPRSVQYKIEYLFPRTPVQTVREPGSVEEALRSGWTVRKESGKQVILTKDGRSITRYRS
ncbi:MAG: hypothetical protein AAB737_01565 [Patescibacteria group bacterium]